MNHRRRHAPPPPHDATDACLENLLSLPDARPAINRLWSVIDESFNQLVLVFSGLIWFYPDKIPIYGNYFRWIRL